MRRKKIDGEEVKPGDIFDEDECEYGNPIRMLNVKYNLPVEVGRKFVGRSETETQETVDSFASFIADYDKEIREYIESDVCKKNYNYAVLFAYEVFKRMRDGAIKTYEEALIEFSNKYGRYLKCRFNYDYSGFDMRRIRKSIQDDGYNDRNSNSKYIKGDIVIGGMPPYGWDKDEYCKLVENEEEQKVIKYIRKLAVDGMGIMSIAEKLNGEGIPSKMGKGWTRTTIRDVLNRHTQG